MAKNPQRFRNRGEEPTVAGRIGAPPAAWVEHAEVSGSSRALVRAWEKLAARIALLPDGVVTAADDLAVELACRLMVRCERDGAKNADFAQLRSMLSELGLTAVGRARLAGPARGGDPEDGDFGEFVRKPARRSA